MLSSLPVFDESQIHARNHKNAIVMFSGGVDSAVALWWALDNYENVKVLIVDYNQPHVIEVEHANVIAEMVNVIHQKIKVGIPSSFWGIENHLTRGQACLMTSLAALDISHDGADIVEGILRTDLYGDCDRDFLDAIAGVLYHYADWNSIGIATPLRAVQDKTDVLALGYQYGVPINLTWTCRDPQAGKPCHRCMQCEQRDNAMESFFKKYNVDEDTYQEWMNVLGSPYHPLFCDVSRDLTIIAQAYIQAGAFKQGTPSWCYLAPDGTKRVSTHIHAVRDPHYLAQGELLNVISAHGYLDDHYRWEVCISADGSVATTDRLPESSVIERALIEKAEI